MASLLLGFGLGTPELLLILAIVILVFGVGKLPTVGKQLGEGIKNFKKEMANPDGEADDAPAELPPVEDQTVSPRDVTEEHQKSPSTT